MTINGSPITDADRIRFLAEAEHAEDSYYEVRSLVQAPPGPRPPPQIAALDPYPTPNRIAIRGEQEAEVLT